jgi:hypothetical protein
LLGGVVLGGNLQLLDSLLALLVEVVKVALETVDAVVESLGAYGPNCIDPI